MGGELGGGGRAGGVGEVGDVEWLDKGFGMGREVWLVLVRGLHLGF